VSAIETAAAPVRIPANPEMPEFPAHRSTDTVTAAATPSVPPEEATMSTIYNDCSTDRDFSAAPVSTALLRGLSKLKTIVLWPFRVLEARRELEMVAQMSEYELKDIGLTRSDLGDATALPADASPTNFLAARVAEGRPAGS
jgi:uncharacterized protein YjiS (DUF1127 family)